MDDDEALNQETSLDLNQYATLIARALYVAADTRLVDLYASLGLLTAEGTHFRAQCLTLHDAIQEEAATVDPNQLEIPGVR
jgi:hypothetical protein